MALRIDEVTISMVGAVRFARQVQRAATSVPLNLSEGVSSRGRNRQARLHDSMGSAKETLACLDVAVAAGYLADPVVAGERQRIDRIVGMPYKLIHRPR